MCMLRQRNSFALKCTPSPNDEFSCFNKHLFIEVEETLLVAILLCLCPAGLWHFWCHHHPHHCPIMHFLMQEANRQTALHKALVSPNRYQTMYLCLWHKLTTSGEDIIAKILHSAWQATDQDRLWADNSINTSSTESSSTSSIRVFDPDEITNFMFFTVLCRQSGTWSIPYISCSYLYISLAGAVNVVTSLGMASYQYMASWMEHQILAVILLTEQWHHSTIPLPCRLYMPL